MTTFFSQTAWLHIESLVKTAAGGHRVIASEAHHAHYEYLEALGENAEVSVLFPNKVTLNKPPANPGALRGTIDSSFSKEGLGVKYRPFKETVVDAARSYAKFAKVKGWSL